MQNKNKIIALVCATALLGVNMTFATESENYSGSGINTSTMENFSPISEKAKEMYKKAMETASGMQMPISKEDMDKIKEKLKNSGQNMEQIFQKAGDKIKQEVKKQEIKKFLSQKTRDLFAKKLDQIPNEKKLEFYNKLITKIDLLIAKSQAEKTKGMLQELKMITQEKINSLSQSSDEQKVLDQIFDDGTPSAVTNSGETN